MPSTVDYYLTIVLVNQNQQLESSVLQCKLPLSLPPAWWRFSSRHPNGTHGFLLDLFHVGSTKTPFLGEFLVFLKFRCLFRQVSTTHITTHIITRYHKISQDVTRYEKIRSWDSHGHLNRTRPVLAVASRKATTSRLT